MTRLDEAEIVAIFIELIAFKGAAWLSRKEKPRRRSATCAAATMR
jgi:hypothetical protein